MFLTPRWAARSKRCIGYFFLLSADWFSQRQFAIEKYNSRRLVRDGKSFTGNARVSQKRIFDWHIRLPSGAIGLVVPHRQLNGEEGPSVRIGAFETDDGEFSLPANRRVIEC